jgi:hypothetical protein
MASADDAGRWTTSRTDCVTVVVIAGFGMMYPFVVEIGTLAMVIGIVAGIILACGVKRD